MPLVPMYKEIGVNGLMPLAVSGGSDPVEIQKRHPDLALIGGIDRNVFERSPEAIEREVTTRAAALYAGGRAIPSGDSHFPVNDQVSLDNMRHYVDLLRRTAQAAWH